VTASTGWPASSADTTRRAWEAIDRGSWVQWRKGGDAAGGARGIGVATALCLAREGCRVGVIGRVASRLTEAADAVEAAGSPEVLRLPGDLASTSDIAAVSTR
jgi:hypothetical protein